MMRKCLGVTAVATIAVAVAACSGKSSSGASNKVTGTIGGNTFTPKSGSFDVIPEIGGTINVGVLSDDPNFCSNATGATPTLKAHSQVMAFLFGTATSSTSLHVATSPGTYTVIDIAGAAAFPPNFFGGEYTMFDSSCSSTSIAYLTTSGSKTVDLTKVSASAINGNGTGLQWSTGDTTDVTFGMKSCPGLIAVFASTAGTCVP